VTLPAALSARAGRSAGFDGWLDRLPRLQRDLLAEWALTPDGQPSARSEALLLPVRTDNYRPAVLKIGFPRPETEHEHLALRAWDGVGAVRLYRADPRRSALLLERPEPGTDLTGLEIHDACEIIAGHYATLHRAATPQLRRLSELAAGWADELRTFHDHPSIPRRLIEHAAGLARDFAADPGIDGALLHTDLHYGTLLAGRRSDHDHRDGGLGDRPAWLAVDARPVSGEREYEVAPLLWHRWDEAVATGDLRNAVLDRIWTVVYAIGLDEDRCRDWVIVRALMAAVTALAGGIAPDSDEVTKLIVIAKAAQR
jgi:streptomycin 6-kinase